MRYIDFEKDETITILKMDVGEVYKTHINEEAVFFSKSNVAIIIAYEDKLSTIQNKSSIPLYQLSAGSLIDYNHNVSLKSLFKKHRNMQDVFNYSQHMACVENDMSKFMYETILKMSDDYSGLGKEVFGTFYTDTLKKNHVSLNFFSGDIIAINETLIPNSINKNTFSQLFYVFEKREKESDLIAIHPIAMSAYSDTLLESANQPRIYETLITIENDKILGKPNFIPESTMGMLPKINISNISTSDGTFENPKDMLIMNSFQAETKAVITMIESFLEQYDDLEEPSEDKFDMSEMNSMLQVSDDCFYIYSNKKKLEKQYNFAKLFSLSLPPIYALNPKTKKFERVILKE